MKQVKQVGGIALAPVTGGASLSMLNSKSPGEYNRMMDATAPDMARPNRPGSAEFEARLAELQKQTQGQAREDLKASSAAQYQEGISNLMQKGGLRGGAAERLEAQNMRGEQNALQGLQREGMEQGARNRISAFNLDKDYYDTDMKEWAATKMARANLEQGRGKGQRGGFVNQIGGMVGK